MVRRGEIWLVALDPTVGHEIQKVRPALVISPPDLNDYLQTVIIAPMTTGSRPAGFRVPIQFKNKGGLVLLDQIRTVDRSRLIKRLGTVPEAILDQCLTGLRDLFER